jgi:hypothetical protein
MYAITSDPYQFSHTSFLAENVLSFQFHLLRHRVTLTRPIPGPPVLEPYSKSGRKRPCTRTNSIIISTVLSHSAVRDSAEDDPKTEDSLLLAAGPARRAGPSSPVPTSDRPFRRTLAVHPPTARITASPRPKRFIGPHFARQMAPLRNFQRKSGQNR